MNNVELLRQLVSNVCDLIVVEIDTIVATKAGEITLEPEELILCFPEEGFPEEEPKYVEKVIYTTSTEVVLRDPYSPDTEVRQISELNVYELLRLYEHLIIVNS